MVPLMGTEVKALLNVVVHSLLKNTLVFELHNIPFLCNEHNFYLQIYFEASHRFDELQISFIFHFRSEKSILVTKMQ